jgi:hypothetical protein
MSCHIVDHRLTVHLHIAATLLGLNFTTTAGVLHYMGAMALLQGKVPLELIKLVGRWRSNEDFKYLHVAFLSSSLVKVCAKSWMTFLFLSFLSISGLYVESLLYTFLKCFDRLLMSSLSFIVGVLPFAVNHLVVLLT